MAHMDAPDAALQAFVKIQELKEETGTVPAFKESLKMLLKIAGNVEKDPENPKFRSIKAANKTYVRHVGLYEAGRNLMGLCGFVLIDGEMTIPAPALPNKGVLRAIQEILSEDTIESYSTAVSASPIPHLEMNDEDFTEADYETLLQLDNQSDVKASKAVPRDVIASWDNTHMITAPTAGTCYVCLEDIPVGMQVMQFACGCMFHPLCIKRWAMESKLCPLCKKDLTEG
eukprot:TRINITY_DN22971_c0_g1_i1.p2 TRINITY_DN22971_c0_g1~~TRINITY_DN22971_c0_g1_i1.p2  ORF type:complete len:229 (+),score=108.85 TRINITY_DN22971_c0_g1_i1:38-724(+)